MISMFLMECSKYIVIDKFYQELEKILRLRQLWIRRVYEVLSGDGKVYKKSKK